MKTKRSTSETGHIKNLENFKDLKEHCARFGPDYNPAAPHLELAYLDTIHTEAQNAQNNVSDTMTLMVPIINERQNKYAELQPIVTRVIQSVSAITNDKKIIADLRTHTNKIHGRPSKPKTNDNEEGQEIKLPRSNSQRSFDKMREHLYNIIGILQNTPNYAPNETELTVAALKTRYDELEQIDNDILAANINYQKALTDRDFALYNPDNGIVKIGQLTKNYIKSVYGMKSPQFNEVKKYTFVTRKR